MVELREPDVFRFNPLAKKKHRKASPNNSHARLRVVRCTCMHVELNGSGNAFAKDIYWKLG